MVEKKGTFGKMPGRPPTRRDVNERREAAKAKLHGGSPTAEEKRAWLGEGKNNAAKNRTPGTLPPTKRK